MLDTTIAGKSLSAWMASHPLISSLQQTQELFWWNPLQQPFTSLSSRISLESEVQQEASARLKRFAPYIASHFPDTVDQSGLIESPLIEITNTQQALTQRALMRRAGFDLPGRLLLKCDNQLPISGSIKARGGIHEVLKFAEQRAVDAGLLTLDSDYSVLGSAECRALFATHRIIVGSTGNLGLSIGIMGAHLGFQVSVHMSADARQWKKDLLRSKGVQVIEYLGDYGQAVAAGRAEAEQTPGSHFVDDEQSLDLFAGYSVAGERLAEQLRQMDIQVDAEHPLCVYLPCGVGGGPGGVAFGLKQQFGDHVHCFFAEPTHSPCMLLGLYTELYEQISVQDIGLDNHTCADGLAVGRPSAFVGRLMSSLLSGLYTVEDQVLYELLALIYDADRIRLEPSALIGLVGLERLLAQSPEMLVQKGLAGQLSQATHIVWATGGSMVPIEEWQKDYDKGRELNTN
ncbi:D-serine ammonia-lyase [Nitrincola sp. MINF-07-Sa-05]|uniref:D-serine ammonia-lyase n=1 Tax=Nitrincola salilacus TaxID=3400273 RepID=UPI003917C940